jgi:hypothetical protein
MRVYTDSLNIQGFKKKILTLCIFTQSNNLRKYGLISSTIQYVVKINK